MLKHVLFQTKIGDLLLSAFEWVTGLAIVDLADLAGEMGDG